MTKKPKFRLYRTLKFEFAREEYLDVIVDPEERRLMTGMRGGINSLRVEVGRWSAEQLEERTCSFCARKEVEDEAHAILKCGTYYRERQELFF